MERFGCREGAGLTVVAILRDAFRTSSLKIVSTGYERGLKSLGDSWGAIISKLLQKGMDDAEADTEVCVRLHALLADVPHRSGPNSSTSCAPADLCSFIWSVWTGFSKALTTTAPRLPTTLPAQAAIGVYHRVPLSAYKMKVCLVHLCFDKPEEVASWLLSGGGGGESSVARPAQRAAERAGSRRLGVARNLVASGSLNFRASQLRVC
ncbi:unnamed protein product [Symbiodinium microadriaticum]|nr:unnamed protein product [Symbiodinium microadriaticum]